MADSKRLRILKALTAQIETVTVANGYQHDLTDAVFRGRISYGSGDPLPMVSILEYVRPDEEVGRASESNLQNDELELLVQGWVLDDKTHPTDPAHNLMADVKKALAEIRDEDSSAYRLSGLVHDAYIDGGIVRPPDDASSKVCFYLKVRLNFVERLNDPYV